MIEFYKHTHEEAIRQSIKDSPNTVGIILAADDSERVKVQITFTYEVPSKYAKAVLADYINEQVAKGGQHGAEH